VQGLHGASGRDGREFMVGYKGLTDDDKTELRAEFEKMGVAVK
jgi:hypothetical protein